ncbi:MAG TPA: GTP-binding protein [Clostridiaceae bacterium]|nr:GTP-binding protein [Clostridiaceae bacterium]
MNQSTTPRGNRLHIAIFGQTNVGKSTLINTLCDQDVALTSHIPGTTTDPIKHAIELGPLGPCVLIDTAGFGDIGPLGAEREARSRRMLAETDLAIWLTRQGSTKNDEPYLLQQLANRNVPILRIVNIIDTASTASTAQNKLSQSTAAIAKPSAAPTPAAKIVATESTDTATLSAPETENSSPIDESLLSEDQTPSGNLDGKNGMHPVRLDVSQPSARAVVIRAIAAILPQAKRRALDRGLLEGWVNQGETVCLVMPQDKGAPHGRLILPQSQTIQELLQRGAIAICTTPDTFTATCQTERPPDLVICDSSVLKEIYAQQPSGVPLTTFSILFAAQKGDIQYFAAGARAMADLKPGARILIAEACSHAPAEEDIGRVKIPALLRQRIQPDLQFDICAGSDLPPDLEEYDLFIQCGACMRNRAFVQDRILRTKALGLPMTNYGVAIAWLSGILDLVCLEPPQ